MCAHKRDVRVAIVFRIQTRELRDDGTAYTCVSHCDVGIDEDDALRGVGRVRNNESTGTLAHV